MLWRPVYANDVDNLIPEIWANESLLILEENMVMAGLVHRDFEDEIANFGETVHTRKPSEFEAVRKTNADAVTTQDVSTDGVDVKLDQWIHVSFIIHDGEQTKAFKDLVTYYLQPAMLANARFLDQALLGQVPQFMANRCGSLQLATSSTISGYMLDAREILNQNKAYIEGRNLVLASASETAALKTEMFVSAEKVGDRGQALRDAYLGRKYGFDTFLSMNTPATYAATQGTAGAVNASVYKGGTTYVAKTTTPVYGAYIVIDGDCYRVDTANSTTITPTRALSRTHLADSVVTIYATGVVDLTAGYLAGFTGKIHVDGTGIPHVGQIVSFNDTSGGVIRDAEYVILQVEAVSSDYEIVLDRPLEVALDNDDVVCYGPRGDFNFAFHRNALALVNRPLALPMSGLAKGAIATYNNMSMRVVITYDGINQGHRVTVDGLFGVKALDTDLGCVMMG